MSELKTLKDIEFGEPGEVVHADDTVMRSHLRKEAIKWIIFLRIDPETHLNKSYMPSFVTGRMKTIYGVDLQLAAKFQIDILKHFFNVTEEELG